MPVGVQVLAQRPHRQDCRSEVLRLAALSRAAMSSDEAITTVRVGIEAPRCVFSLSSKARTMPNRIPAFLGIPLERGRVYPHCSVDGTTPRRGADLSHRRRNRIGRDTIQGMKCSVESIADITRWSSERNADRL